MNSLRLTNKEVKGYEVFLLWLGISIMLLFVTLSVLTAGSKIDDIFLGDDQYKTKEELNKEINE